MPESTVATEVEKETPSKAEAVKKILEMKEQLKKAAEAQFTGAAPAATATMLLDKTQAEKLNPEHRVRWVSLRNEQKAQMRVNSGYVRLSAEEGGRQVGNLVLMKLPREEHERRVAAIKKLNQDRLSVHNREAEAMAEQIAKELRDNHGISVRPETLLGERAGEPRR